MIYALFSHNICPNTNGEKRKDPQLLVKEVKITFCLPPAELIKDNLKLSKK